MPEGQNWPRVKTDGLLLSLKCWNIRQEIRIRVQRCSFKEVILYAILSIGVLEYVGKVFGLSNYIIVNMD